MIYEFIYNFIEMLHDGDNGYKNDQDYLECLSKIETYSHLCPIITFAYITPSNYFLMEYASSNNSILFKEDL